MILGEKKKKNYKKGLISFENFKEKKTKCEGEYKVLENRKKKKKEINYQFLPNKAMQLISNAWYTEASGDV